MKIRYTYCWDENFDWIIIPSLMLGVRSYGFGIAFLFLKIKTQLIFKWATNENLG